MAAITITDHSSTHTVSSIFPFCNPQTTNRGVATIPSAYGGGHGLPVHEVEGVQRQGGVLLAQTQQLDADGVGCRGPFCVALEMALRRPDSPLQISCPKQPAVAFTRISFAPRFT